MTERNLRFRGADWYNSYKSDILVAGVGGIGSYTATFLARADMPVLALDFDKVERHNVGGQIFMDKHIGMYKVDALKDVVTQYGVGNNLKTFNGKIEELNKIPSIVVAAFDNMAARKYLFEKWRRNPFKELFIDGRLAAEVFQVYVVTPEREQAYEQTLFSDEEAQPLACSYQQTSHVAAMIGSTITQLILNYVAETYVGRYRELPFEIEFNGQMFYMSTNDFDDENLYSEQKNTVQGFRKEEI